MPPGIVDRADRARVAVDGLRAGVKLTRNLYDDRMAILLIAGGQTLTAAIIAKLHARGITHVQVSAADLARVTRDEGESPAGKSAPTVEPSENSLGNLLEEFQRGAPQVSKPDSHQFGNALAEKPSRTLENEFRARFEKSVARIKGVFHLLVANKSADLAAAKETVREYLEDLAKDQNLFLLVSMSGDPNGYPYAHSAQVARLALGTGKALGLQDKDLSELGLGCVLHDVGMLMLDKRLLNAERPLAIVEKLDITKHPTVSYDLLQCNPSVPAAAKMIAHQMHERLDGTGYPRRREASQIHQLSKIAMVADVFVAMISPRPHRPAIVPHYAITEVAELSGRGKLDRAAARGLVDAVSMYPLGSLVELDDGRISRVVKANHGAVSTPVVEAWYTSAPDSIETVNLKLSTTVKITGPYLGVHAVPFSLRGQE